MSNVESNDSQLFINCSITRIIHYLSNDQGTIISGLNEEKKGKREKEKKRKREKEKKRKREKEGSSLDMD